MNSEQEELKTRKALKDEVKELCKDDTKFSKTLKLIDELINHANCHGIDMARDELLPEMTSRQLIKLISTQTITEAEALAALDQKKKYRQFAAVAAGQERAEITQHVPGINIRDCAFEN